MPESASCSASPCAIEMPSSLSMLLVRHGHTAWSRSGRYQGRSDLPLLPEGRAQASQLGQRLKGRGVSHVFASPLLRAAQTAQIIAEVLGLGVPILDTRLAEIAYGQWEGLTQAEIRRRWPDQLRQWKRFPDGAAAPGGESLGELRERLNHFLTEPPWSAPMEGTVLLVSHLGPIRLALLQAARQPLSMFRQLPVPIASVHRLMLCCEANNFRLSTTSQEQESCALQ